MRFEKVTAILRLARELSGSAEGITLDEISATYQVSRRTAERMRDAVESAFGPLEWTGDGKKKRFRIAARGLRNFANTPTAEELAELENGIRLNEAAGDQVRANSLRSLSEKIRVSLRDQDRRRLATDIDAYLRGETFSRQVGPRPFPEASVFQALREALLCQRIITFAYPTADNRPRKRTVVPYGLLFGPRYCLVGAETKKNAPVLFRLDRISKVIITAVPGIPPIDFNLDDYANQSFGVYQEPPESVELYFAPEFATDAKAYLFHHTQIFEEQVGGGVQVRFKVGGLLEVARELMSWGDGVKVVKPLRLQKILKEEIEKLYKHHVKN